VLLLRLKVHSLSFRSENHWCTPPHLVPWTGKQTLYRTPSSPISAPLPTK